MGQKLVPHLPVKCGNKMERLVGGLCVPYVCKANNNDGMH